MAAQEENKPLRESWNRTTLRFGDKVGELSELTPAHSNAWDPEVVSRLAWLQIGGNKHVRQGICGDHRGEAILSTVAGVALSLQQTHLTSQNQ